MSVRGSLRTMSVEDLLDWIDRRLLCGSLTIERGNVVRVFSIDSRQVTGVGSNIPGERLGQVLLRRGLLRDDALREAFRVQADTGVALGKILLMVGAVEEQALRKSLEDKIRESICDVVSWQEGAFQFDDAEPGQPANAFRVTASLRNALDRGIGEAERRRQIRRLVPSVATRFYICDGAQIEDGASGAGANSRLREAVAREAGEGHSAGEIALEFFGDQFRVVSILAELIESGAIAIDRRADTRPSDLADGDQLGVAVRGRAAGGDLQGALAMALEALEHMPDDERVLELYRDVERTLFAELSRDLLSGFRVPRLLRTEKELDGEAFNQQERYLLGRIDGHWDLMSLLRVSPLREVDALLTLKRLADRGIITL